MPYFCGRLNYQISLLLLLGLDEIDTLLCGRPDFKVEVLKQATIYDKVAPTNK
jgi:hypothetical protein